MRRLIFQRRRHAWSILRLGVTASLLVTITSEMLLSTNGIGAFVQRSQESFYVASGLAGIVAIALMGLIVNLGQRLIEQRLLSPGDCTRRDQRVE